MSSFNNHRLNKNEPIGSFITDSFVAVGGFGQPCVIETKLP